MCCCLSRCVCWHHAGRKRRSFRSRIRHRHRRFYRERFLSFNVPDFVTGPARFDSRQAVRAINAEQRKDFGVRP